MFIKMWVLHAHSEQWRTSSPWMLPDAGGALSRFAMQHGATLPPPPPSIALQSASAALRQRRSIFASAELARAGSGVQMLHTVVLCQDVRYSGEVLLQVCRTPMLHSVAHNLTVLVRIRA
jgi:hypothetical protein